LADDELDPCKKNGHLTDIEFTCCAGVRYKSPEMYRNKEYIDSCLKRSEKGGIVKTAVKIHYIFQYFTMTSKIEISTESVVGSFQMHD